MTDEPTRTVSVPPRFQFGIRGLLIFTTIIAILCSLAVCTHWIVAVTLGTIVLLAWIAGKVVRSSLIRNVLVCAGGIPTLSALLYLEHQCGFSALNEYEAMFWPVIYFSTVWANWHVVRKDKSPLLKWSVRILLSALLLPLYAVIIAATVLCIQLALGIPVLHS
jgi:hypothetical protein